MKTLEILKNELEKLTPTDRIEVLAWLYANYRHQYDYATMSDSLRRFYDSKSVRPH